MIKKAIAILLIVIAIVWSFKALMPSSISDLDTDKNLFSTARALAQLEKLSQKEHSVGTGAHAEVRDYIVGQLESLGLETSIQDGFTISQWGNLAHAKNILARIKGRIMLNTLAPVLVMS